MGSDLHRIDLQKSPCLCNFKLPSLRQNSWTVPWIHPELSLRRLCSITICPSRQLNYITNIAAMKVKNDITPRSVENCNLLPSFGELGLGLAVLLDSPPVVPPPVVVLGSDDFSVLRIPPWTCAGTVSCIDIAAAFLNAARVSGPLGLKRVSVLCV